MRVGVIDCGGGNVTSVVNALTHVGAAVARIEHAGAVDQCSHLVLPGVGSFPETMQRLDSRGFCNVIRAFVRSHKPLLGICIGMQVLADRGDEFGQCRGMGLVSGSVTRIDTDGAGDRLPHMGWNDVTRRNDCPLFAGLEHPTFYFLHSYRFSPAIESDVAGWCDYGDGFCAVLRRDNIFGVQFHPEKSQSDGLRLLSNFATLSLGEWRN